MITPLNYTVPIELLLKAATSIPSTEFKESINQPSGNFFYESWTVKPEFKDTVWDKILSTLPGELGEARIITLGYGCCYQSHADIDDRYHLNIASQYAYLINLQTDTMHPLSTDGIWYEMNAGSRHSAANFGYINRVQLVVRKLLTRNKLIDPIKIKMYYAGKDKDSVRFMFDDVLSPWLNKSNKRRIITNFSHEHNDVRFEIEKENLIELKNLLPEDFELEIL